MIVIESDARTIADDLLDPLLDALCAEVTPRVQIHMEPGWLSATTEDGTTSQMRTDSGAFITFSIDGDYLLDLHDELGRAVREGLDATIRVGDSWFAVESPAPHDPETDTPAQCDMTEIGPAFAAV